MNYTVNVQYVDSNILSVCDFFGSVRMEDILMGPRLLQSPALSPKKEKNLWR